MMKIILSIFLLFTMTGCMNQNSIEPTKFSKETTHVLSFFKNQIAFFSLRSPKEAKSIEIRLCTLKDGVWEEETISQSEAINDDFALQVLDDAISIIHYDKEGWCKSTYNRIAEEKEYTANIRYTLSEKKMLKIGEPVSLWVDVSTNEDGVSIGENYEDLKYESGMAITIVALDTPIPE